MKTAYCPTHGKIEPITPVGRVKQYSNVADLELSGAKVVAVRLECGEEQHVVMPA